MVKLDDKIQYTKSKISIEPEIIRIKRISSPESGILIFLQNKYANTELKTPKRAEKLLFRIFSESEKDTKNKKVNPKKAFKKKY